MKSKKKEFVPNLIKKRSLSSFFFRLYIYNIFGKYVFILRHWKKNHLKCSSQTSETRSSTHPPTNFRLYITYGFNRSGKMNYLLTDKCLLLLIWIFTD